MPPTPKSSGSGPAGASRTRNLCRNQYRDGGQDRGRNRTRKTPLTGSAGYAIVQLQPPGRTKRSAQLRYRALHGESAVSISPGLPRGRRSRDQRGRYPPGNPLTTALIARRWDAHGGPEGRSRGTGRLRDAEDRRYTTASCGRDARTTTVSRSLCTGHSAATAL